MTREELQHDFHNKQGINWLNSQGEPDIDYVMWLENKILAIKNNTPLPPAEGAEEILLSHPYLKVMYDDTAGEVCMVEQAIWAIEKFATLHAQRIAEKMVSERLRKELMMFGDYFNNLDPNDHILVNHILVNDIDKYLKSREMKKIIKT